MCVEFLLCIKLRSPISLFCMTKALFFIHFFTQQYISVSPFFFCPSLLINWKKKERKIMKTEPFWCFLEWNNIFFWDWDYCKQSALSIGNIKLLYKNTKLGSFVNPYLKYKCILPPMFYGHSTFCQQGIGSMFSYVKHM